MYRLFQSSALLGAGLLASSMAFAAIDGTWTEDFESCALSDLDALGTPFDTNTCGAGSADLEVFMNVYNASGGYLYGYGVFPAPNNAADPSASISGLAAGEGGAAQGAQQLNFFNDYNNRGEHDPDGDGDPVTGAGVNTVEANIFNEWTIDASDVGKTYVFKYSYKYPTTNALAAPSTANAYIKTLDPGAGFATTNFVSGPVTDSSGDWVEDIEISLVICGGLIGQIFQVGFTNTAIDDSPSGIIYDNLSVLEGTSGPDTDLDDCPDSVDNCTSIANYAQQDADADGHGNICDGDFDNTCTTNFADLVAFKSGFNTADAELDLNSSGGNVNFADLVIFKGLFNTVPGPSPVGSLCNP